MNKGSFFGWCALLTAGCISTESGNPEFMESAGGPASVTAPDPTGVAPGPAATFPASCPASPSTSPTSLPGPTGPSPQGSGPGVVPVPEPPCEFAVGADGGAFVADGGAAERVYRCAQEDGGVICSCGEPVTDDAPVPISSGTACTNALQAQCGWVAP